MKKLTLAHVYRRRIPTSPNARSQKRSNPTRERTIDKLNRKLKPFELELHPTKGWR